MARPRKYASAAERQRAYRERLKQGARHEEAPPGIGQEVQHVGGGPGKQAGDQGPESAGGVDRPQEVREAPLPAPRRERHPVKPAELEFFFERLAAGDQEYVAAQKAGHPPQAFKWHRDKDPEIARRWQEAWEQGTQILEQEATNRGLHGYDEETFNGDDELIRKTHRYDSALLQQQLKRRRPEAYRDTPQTSQGPTVIIFENPFAAVAPQADITLEAIEEGEGG